jgi:hypothetical protein
VTDRRSSSAAARRPGRRAAAIARVAVALVLVPLSVLLAAPANAATHPDDGADPGSGLTGLQTVLIFAVTPLAIVAVISLLASVPSMAHGPRYRPGLGWWAAPVWFNGPDEPDGALRAIEAQPAEQLAPLSAGGASARW